METYLVGGAVRDRLLGLPVTERDWVVVGATPEEMIAQGYTRVGKDFPVFLHPESKEEYALARTERKSGHGYTGFEICASKDITLEQDLLRRDLTINAMAETGNGELIDPYGGSADLQNKLLRHVSAAFAEDPVRILRVARFAARFAHLGFQVAHDTVQLMQRMVDDGEADYLVPERVWSELARALATGTPVQFFNILDKCGALELLFPQLAEIYSQHYSNNDNATRLPTLSAACGLSNSIEVRFAALVCDMNTDIDQLDQLCSRHRVPNSLRQLAELAVSCRKHVHDIDSLSAKEIIALLENIDAFRRGDRIRDFLLVCEADARGRNLGMGTYKQADQLLAALQAARNATADIADKNGREIGEAIRQARIAAIDDNP